MSNRSLVELNHDYCPKDDQFGLARWAMQMRLFMLSGDQVCLPQGVTLKHIRHHSEPCPLELLQQAIETVLDVLPDEDFQFKK